MIKDITKKDKSELTFKEKVIINIYDMASVLAVSVVTIMIIFTFVFKFKSEGDIVGAANRF